MLRVAVIGVGSQGRHHIKLLKQIDGVETTLLVDRDPDKAKQAGEEFQIRSAQSYRELYSEFDAAIVAVPTIDHFTIASELIEAGKHVLIEKPVTTTVEDAELLAAVAERYGTIAQVGFPERFNPAVQKATQEITRPLFVEVHRLGVFSPRSLDVDVVLDLMIHDLDLLYLFLREEAVELESVGVPVISRNVDIANARLKFPGNCVVNLTASRVSAQKMRKMRLFQPYCYLSLDLAQQSFSLFTVRPDLCNAGFPEIHSQEFQPQQQQHPLEQELIAFRDATQGRASSGVSVQEAIPSLRMALAIKAKFLPIR
jgi:predicted dehydrogenase